MMFVAWPVVEAFEIILTGGPAGAGVELGDRDQQEGHAQTDQRAAVELAEAERVVSNASITGMNPSAERTVAAKTALVERVR